MEPSERSAQEEIYSYKHIKKQERSQINNLTLQLKSQKKKSKLNSKLAEGRK